MHDLALGGPYRLDTYEGGLVNGKPLHSGPCYDGVYGCHLCHNATSGRYTDEDGKERFSFCDVCGEEKPTQVKRSLEENAMYAYCKECRFRHVVDNTEPGH